MISGVLTFSYLHILSSNYGAFATVKDLFTYS